MGYWEGIDWVKFAAQFSYDTTDVVRPFMIKESGVRIQAFEALHRAFNAGQENKRVQILNRFLDLRDALEEVEEQLDNK